MNLFRYDSPLFEFLNKVTDLFILNVLCLICCIPIITIGPALTAKYDVAMRIVRKEEPSVLKPYFKAFKENFKQSLIVWLILLAACLLLCIDWSWMIDTGLLNVPTLYFAAAVFITVIVSFIIMTIFPIIARFEVTVKEAFKTSAVFAMLYFYGLVPIIILIVFSVYLCYRYMRYLPLVLVLSHVTIVFCLCLVLMRGFAKLEKQFADPDEEADEDTEKVGKSDGISLEEKE